MEGGVGVPWRIYRYHSQVWPPHQRWMLSEEVIQEGSLEACGCGSYPREKGELFIPAVGKELALH